MGLRHLLVYCGSGSTEDPEVGDVSIRDIEKAQRTALASCRLQSARITADESASKRQSILNAFASGSLHSVFAIKVLDEGFDMPGIRGAVLLASSRNERQFIQRRGRVLRRSHGKDKAFIWDFVVSGEGVMHSQYAAELATLELARALEFARLSESWAETSAQLREFAARFDIDFDAVLDSVTASRYEVDPSE